MNTRHQLLISNNLAGKQASAMAGHMLQGPIVLELTQLANYMHRFYLKKF